MGKHKYSRLSDDRLFELVMELVSTAANLDPEYEAEVVDRLHEEVDADGDLMIDVIDGYAHKIMKLVRECSDYMRESEEYIVDSLWYAKNTV